VTNLIEARKARRSKWIVVLLIFILAFVPRALSLNAFSAIDEYQWQRGARTFINGLLSGDFSATYCRFHPAVTDMWLIAIGLGFKYLLLFLQGGHPAGFQAFLEQSIFPGYPNADFLVAERLPFALVTSISVVLVYFLVRKLFGNPTAWLGAGLLALDPFYISHSRVVTPDGLLASFMTLSILSFIVYLVCERSRYYVIFSGFAAGLALLTKISSLLLVPIVGVLTILMGLWEIHRVGRPQSQTGLRFLGDLTIWGGVAFLTFFCLWPIMWVAPVNTIQRMAVDMNEISGGWHQFLMGRRTEDPGPLFYPIVLLFRTTPLTLIGAVASLIFSSRVSLQQETRNPKNEIGEALPASTSLVMLVIYIILFALLMSSGSTKFDRFLLPIFPATDILAAVGWCSVCGGGVRRMSRTVDKRWVSGAGVTALLILQLGISLPHHPYYLTAYNPLVGGGYVAPHVLLIGWGEGLEKAARYLNRRDEEHPINVVSWYGKCLAPFFHGHSQDFPPYERDLFRQDTDYAVLYINQLQREMWPRYFWGWEAEYTVRLKGIDYAWVYPIPKPAILQNPQIEHPAEINFDHKLMFLGYNVEEIVQKTGEPSWLEKHLKGSPELLPEHRTFFRITHFWQCLEEMAEDYTLVTQFEGRHGKTYHLDQSHQGVNGVYPTSMWQVGEIIGEEYQVEVPADYPPIRYALWVGVQDGETRLEVVGDIETDEEDRARLGEIEVLPAERPTSLTAEPRPQNRVEMNINNELAFLGYDLRGKNPKPGDRLEVTTYWQSLRKTKRDYAIQVELGNSGYKVRETLDMSPTRLWEEGGYYRGSVAIAVNPRILGGTYSLNLRVEREDGVETQVSLASLDIPWKRQHIIKRLGKATYGGSEILGPDEPLSLRFDLKERESLEVMAGWTGKAESEETRVEVYLWQPYSSERYLGTWVIRSGRYTITKRRIPDFLTAPGENVIELRVPEVRERVHNIGWRGVMDRVFPDLLQDPRTDYDGPIQMDFAQVSTRWEGNWDDYYDLAQVYAEREMMGEVARLYEEAVDKGVEPARVDEFALFKRAYKTLGEDGKVGEIEERIAGRIAHQMRVNLGGKVEFLGYSWEKEGDGHGLSLFFRCLEEMEEDYTLWVHGEVEDESVLEGQRGEAGYAVFDHLLSTSRWQVGEVYQDDEVRGLKPGRYHFTLGLWRPEDGSRLWWEDDPEAHVIDLGWVEVR
jgi:4-amino-4-deoxy-L-arabinose transferase-like glycosyltransferase